MQKPTRNSKATFEKLCQNLREIRKQILKGCAETSAKFESKY